MELLTDKDFCALAEFRYQIRKFLIISEEIAKTGGLEPQQYLLLLQLRGLPPGKESTIRVLAERLQLRHNSTVELVDRLAHRGLVRRSRSNKDSRKVFIRLTARGGALIAKLVHRRFVESAKSQLVLLRALSRVLAEAKENGPKGP